VAAVAVCCMILSCLAVSEQSSFGIVGDPEATAVTCKNTPTCVLKAPGGDQDAAKVCGNSNDSGTTGGGGCDPKVVSCVCQLGGICRCSN
jgi:hypothetical protein